MNEVNHRQSSILWGIVIGGSLGFMESAISIRLWHEFDSPDFLVRPHHLELHTFMHTTGGIVCGIIFGILVRSMSGRLGVSVRFFPFFLSIMLIGFLLFSVQYWIVLRFQVPLWLIGDAILFVGGLALVQAFMRKENAQLTDE